MTDPRADPQTMSASSRSLKSRKRTQSRASTSSIHSATTQPNLSQGFAESGDTYAAHWLANEAAARQRDIAPAPQQPSQDDLTILQNAQLLQSARDFSLDTSMNASFGNSASFHQHMNMSRASLPAGYSADNSFADDSQVMDRDDDSAIGATGVSKSNRSSANNELEMRQLFASNRHRNLQDVAEELHGNERGPNSERTRQVFAMLWYVVPADL